MTRQKTSATSTQGRFILLCSVFALTACSTWFVKQPPEGKLRPETVWAITGTHELVNFNAGRPQHLLSRQPLRGLSSGERVVGMDYRVARGVLYVLADSGQLYTLDTTAAQLTAVGKGVFHEALKSQRVGVDFNPVADRIRVVSASGHNLRMHPDTGAWVDADPQSDGLQADAALKYTSDDAQVGRQPMLAAAAYTYDKDNDKVTTNYAIDLAGATLVMQGSKAGAVPVVSPNTGWLHTVGALGLHGIDNASFDISDVRNTALAALRQGQRTRLYEIDLATGAAQLLGAVGQGEPLLGMAIEP